MADEPEALKTCDECGATIYPEHLVRGVAQEWNGRLLCIHCLKERGAAAPAVGVPPEAPSADIPIALADDEETPSVLGLKGGVTYETKPTAIRAFGGGPGGMAEGISVSEKNLRRPLLKDSPNATRCRIFHCKLADPAMAYMCEQINEWADSREDIQIKFATSCIGVVEGKHADPHLIVTVFY